MSNKYQQYSHINWDSCRRFFLSEGSFLGVHWDFSVLEANFLKWMLRVKFFWVGLIDKMVDVFAVLTYAELRIAFKFQLEAYTVVLFTFVLFAVAPFAYKQASIILKLLKLVLPPVFSLACFIVFTVLAAATTGTSSSPLKTDTVFLRTSSVLASTELHVICQYL